ncbi:hypothetical protein [Flavobacterium sp. LHD-85]|uniref:hypothetical protein n=1 Tax=Flavobacterium sp. LHD-85 TaxID=3071410 RepID=UPI0027E0EA1E|nr:hypothetical protein [Flavobacterium sp. LHD-85]MDQ6531022.1 hypothetical protein [Flavobacterium sp. LHD-85]
MKNKWIKIVLKITAVFLILVLIIMVIPENSFLFKQRPIENQQQLGTEILTAFKNKYVTVDTVFIATGRNYFVECGTGIESSLLDKIKYNIVYKYKKLTHRNIIYKDNVFPLSQKRSDKIVVTEIITYDNESMPNDSDLITVGNEQSLTHLKSSSKKIFLVDFVSVTSDKVEVVFTDYKKSSTAFQFSLVCEKNDKWKILDK